MNVQACIWRNRFARFTRFPAFVQCWFPATWLLLGIARLMIRLIPFRQFAPSLGDTGGVTPWVPLLSLPQYHRARLIGRVVQTAANYTPWTSNCFPQAIVVSWLLRLYGVPYGLYLGVKRLEGSVAAHAWVASGRVSVTGGAGFMQYTVVGCFYSIRAA